MWVRGGKEGGNGSAGEMLSLEEWRSLNPVIFKLTIFITFLSYRSLCPKTTLTQKPSMEAHRAGHLSFQVAVGRGRICEVHI